MIKPSRYFLFLIFLFSLNSTTYSRNNNLDVNNYEIIEYSFIVNSNVISNSKSQYSEPKLVSEPIKYNPKHSITFIGDSVMKGSEHLIKKHVKNSFVDAKVSRQFTSLPEILMNLSNKGQLHDTVVIHLGSNGAFTDKSFYSSMNIIGDRKVYFINCGIKRNWELSINNQLQKNINKYKNAKLLDWSTVVKKNQTLLSKDGAHPTINGREVYTKFIINNIN